MNRTSVSATSQRGEALGGVTAEAGLTERERAVLTLLAGGLLHREIALRLGIARPTVDVHLAHAKDKLGARTSAELVAIAVRGGLLPGSCRESVR